MLFTASAVLCMFVGARRLAFAKTYSPRPCSTCIHAPTWLSTNDTQFGFHCSKALVWRAASTLAVICRTTFELYL